MTVFGDWDRDINVFAASSEQETSIAEIPEAESAIHFPAGSIDTRIPAGKPKFKAFSAPCSHSPSQD